MWAMIKFFAYSIPLFGYLMDLAKVPMVYPKESQFLIDTVSASIRHRQGILIIYSYYYLLILLSTYLIIYLSNYLLII